MRNLRSFLPVLALGLFAAAAPVAHAQNVAPSFTLPAGPLSTAGATWTARDSARNWRSVASSSDGSKLVAVEYRGQIYTGASSIPAITVLANSGLVTSNSFVTDISAGTASDVAGNTAPASSASTTFTVTPAATVPGAPTIGTATAGDAHATFRRSPEINGRWYQRVASATYTTQPASLHQ